MGVRCLGMSVIENRWGLGKTVLKRTLGVLLVCGLVGCGGSGSRAPVEDRNNRASPSSSPLYAVQGGDTLYSIAFRYGFDYRKVAAANGIPAPYTIYPGQTIYLREAPAAPVAPSATPAPVATAPAAKKPAPLKPVTAPSSAPVTVPPVAKQTAPAPGAPAAVPPKPVYQALPAATPGRTPAPLVSNAKVTSWRWPASGAVTRRYSSSVHKGIDIGGQRGDPIHAVADGVVVYAGTGIVGFGELVIIKHNDIYISAYGHNDKLLVRENDPVRAGQKIAQKGNSGTDTVKLHFEIRKEGKPVDPLKLLPAR